MKCELIISLCLLLAPSANCCLRGGLGGLANDYDYNNVEEEDGDLEPIDEEDVYDEYDVDEDELLDRVNEEAREADEDYAYDDEEGGGGDNDPGSGGPGAEEGAVAGPEEPGSGGPLAGILDLDDGDEGGEEAIGGEQDQGQGTAGPPVEGAAPGGQDEGVGAAGPGQGAGVGGPDGFQDQRGSGGPRGEPGNECGLGGSSRDKFYGNCNEFVPSAGGNGNGAGGNGNGAGGTGTGTGTGGNGNGGGNGGTGSGSNGGGPGGNGAGGPGGNGAGGAGGAGGAEVEAGLLALFLGVEVTYTFHDPSYYYELNGGPVVVEGELDCDVDNKCCWNNAAPPTDTLEFQVGEGAIEPALLQSTFGVNVPPDGKFMVAVSGGENPLYEAQLVSCSIVCTNEPVTVSLMYWKTSDIQIQICSREAFFNHPELNPLLHCVDIDTSEMPGPSKVVLPPGEMFDVVIAVRNFANPSGDVVILDNIRVDYILCPEQPFLFTTTPELTTTTAGPTTTPEEATDATTEVTDSTDEPEPTDYPEETTEAPEETTEAPTGDDTAAECAAIECDFEDGTMCSYSSVAATDIPTLYKLERPRGPLKRIISEKQVRTKITVYRVYKGRIFNYVTGVRWAAQGTQYSAVYLKKKTASVMRTEVTLTQKRVVRAKYYAATADFDMFACCFTEGKPNCRMISDPKPTEADREWQDVQFVCGAQTTEVYFICSAQKSKNQGACALDDIRLYEYDETTYVKEDTTVELVPVCS